MNSRAVHTHGPQVCHRLCNLFFWMVDHGWKL